MISSANDFFRKWEKSIQDESFSKLFLEQIQKNNIDRDWDEMDAILESVSSKDIDDCVRILLRQDNSVINSIYDKMFDKNGNETDYLPLGCKYETLFRIIVENGGSSETFDYRKAKELKNKIKIYEQKIKNEKQKIEIACNNLEKRQEGFLIELIEMDKNIIKIMQNFRNNLNKMIKQHQEKLLMRVLENNKEYELKNNLFSDKNK